MSGSQHPTVPASKEDVIKFMKEAITEHIYDYIRKDIDSKIMGGTSVIIYDPENKCGKLKQQLDNKNKQEKLAYQKTLTLVDLQDALSVEQKERLHSIEVSLKKFPKDSQMQSNQTKEKIKELKQEQEAILSETKKQLTNKYNQPREQAAQEEVDELKEELLMIAAKKLASNLQELYNQRIFRDSMTDVINLFTKYAVRYISPVHFDGKQKQMLDMQKQAERSFRKVRKMFQEKLKQPQIGCLGGNPILNEENFMVLFNKIKNDLRGRFQQYQDILSSVDDSVIDSSRSGIDFMLMMDVEGLVNSGRGEEKESTIPTTRLSARSTPRSSAISSAKSTPRSTPRESHPSSTRSDPKSKKTSKQPKLPANHLEIASKREQIADQFNTLKTKFAQLSGIHGSRSASHSKKIEPHTDSVFVSISDLGDNVEAIFINFQDNQDLNIVNLDHIASSLEAAVNILPDDLNLYELPAEFIGNIKDILDEIAREIDDLQAVEMGSDIDESNSVMAPTDVLFIDQSGYDLFELLREIVEQKIIDNIPKEPQQFIEQQIIRLREEHFRILQDAFQKSLDNKDLGGVADLVEGLISKLSFSTYLGKPNFQLGDDFQNIFAPLSSITEQRSSITMLPNATRGSSSRDIIKIVLDDIIDFFSKLDADGQLAFIGENTYKSFSKAITDLTKFKNSLDSLQKVDINSLINNISDNLGILNTFIKSNVNLDIAQALSILKLLATDDVSGIEKLVSLLSASEYKRIMTQFAIKELYKKNSIATAMPSLLLNYAIPILDEFKRQAIKEKENDSSDDLKKQSLQSLIIHIDDAIIARQQINVLVEDVHEIVNHINELSLHATTETNVDNISKILVQLSNDIPHKLQRFPL